MECPVCGAALALALTRNPENAESGRRRQEWIDRISEAELHEAQQNHPSGRDDL